MKRGFGSPNFSKERHKEMSRLGGKRSHLKGNGYLESLGIEERIAFAKKGNKASHAGHKKRVPENPFDVI